MASPLILVTNDDGVYAPGVRALFEAMRSLGEAVIVAPERDNSAVSHALTMNRPLRVMELENSIYTLDGTPTDCVTLAVNKILPAKPDLIVSGINPGANREMISAIRAQFRQPLKAPCMVFPPWLFLWPGRHPTILRSQRLWPGSWPPWP